MSMMEWHACGNAHSVDYRLLRRFSFHSWRCASAVYFATENNNKNAKWIWKRKKVVCVCDAEWRRVQCDCPGIGNSSSWSCMRCIFGPHCVRFVTAAPPINNSSYSHLDFFSSQRECSMPQFLFSFSPLVRFCSSFRFMMFWSFLVNSSIWTVFANNKQTAASTATTAACMPIINGRKCSRNDGKERTKKHDRNTKCVRLFSSRARINNKVFFSHW